MGERRIRICDRCSQELDSAIGPSLNFRGVEIFVVTHKSMWGEKEYVVQWKGELCDRCHTIVERLHQTFNELMNIEEPKIELPSAKAVTQPLLRKRRKP